jgi:hypothetical protein
VLAVGPPGTHSVVQAAYQIKDTHKKIKSIIALAGVNKADSTCTQGKTAKKRPKQLAVLCEPLFHQGQFFEQVAVSSRQLPNLKRIDNGRYAL